MIAILGQPNDTASYVNRKGYNVHAPDLTPDQVKAWIHEAVTRGDKLELVSTDFTGMYSREIRWLRGESQKKRGQAAVLIDQAREIEEAISDVSKWARHLTSVV